MFCVYYDLNLYEISWAFSSPGNTNPGWCSAFSVPLPSVHHWINSPSCDLSRELLNRTTTIFVLKRISTNAKITADIFGDILEIISRGWSDLTLNWNTEVFFIHAVAKSGLYVLHFLEGISCKTVYSAEFHIKEIWNWIQHIKKFLNTYSVM